MGKKILSICTALLFCASFTFTAMGQSGSESVKIAVLDIQRVMSSAPEMESIQQKLNSFIEQKQQQLEQRTSNFQQQVAQYQEGQASMSQQQQTAREKELAQKEQELRTFQQNLQAEIQNYRQQLLSPIYSEIDSVIAAVAESRDIDFVLNKSTSRGEEIVRYVGIERLDITEEVSQRINSN